MSEMAAKTSHHARISCACTFDVTNHFIARELALLKEYLTAVKSDIFRLKTVASLLLTLQIGMLTSST